MEIKYGRLSTNGAMCYPTFITNKQTYGPFGADMDSSTNGLQISSDCENEKYTATLPQLPEAASRLDQWIIDNYKYVNIGSDDDVYALRGFKDEVCEFSRKL